MATPISGITPIIKSIPDVPGSKGNASTVQNLDFSQVLSQALSSVNGTQESSNQLGNLLASGQVDDLHTVMIESTKADLSLQFTLQVRNKIIDAYNEIMRMQF